MNIINGTSLIIWRVWPFYLLSARRSSEGDGIVRRAQYSSLRLPHRERNTGISIGTVLPQPIISPQDSATALAEFVHAMLTKYLANPSHMHENDRAWLLTKHVSYGSDHTSGNTEVNELLEGREYQYLQILELVVVIPSSTDILLSIKSTISQIQTEYVTESLRINWSYINNIFPYQIHSYLGSFSCRKRSSIHRLFTQMSRWNRIQSLREN